MTLNVAAVSSALVGRGHLSCSAGLLKHFFQELLCQTKWGRAPFLGLWAAGKSSAMGAWRNRGGQDIAVPVPLELTPVPWRSSNFQTMRNQVRSCTASNALEQR